MTMTEKAKTTVFTVNGIEVQTAEKHLTVREILELAGFEPDSHYLVEKHGKSGSETEHRNLDEEIEVHNKHEFLAFFTGPTPVS